VGDRSTDVVTYLPASLMHVVADGQSSDLPWHREVEGTMVMADLSGFTALSERLARLGDEGAERLTAIINSFFERMLKTASRYGGDTLTFGGDAILLLFDGPEHATRGAVAALEMLKQVDRAAAVEADDGKVKIGMSVGAHSDSFVLAAAGLADDRAQLVVLGRGAEQTALAESQAERGQLAVSSTCKELLPDGSTLVPTGDYWRVVGLGACASPRLTFGSPPLSSSQLSRLEPFLPPYARGRGEEGGAANPSSLTEKRADQSRLTPEHRRTVIVFVNILGLNKVIESAGVDAAVEQLQAYSTMLTRLAARHQGFVLSSDIATKGSKLIVTFGAPVAHEYAPANAARFALDLNAELRRSGLDLSHKIGVNGGHVFAGEVGPPFRRQYTVMGDAVNLAARLMGAAEPGEALVSHKLLEYSGPALCARELAPIKVKGKEQPVAVCVLEEERRAGGQLRGGAGSGPRRGRLFGRRAELDVIRQRWQQTRRGEGRTVLIEGDAGVGKTRLLEEALRGLPDSARVTRAACFEHLQAAPFTPWVEALQSIFEIARDDSGGRRSELVQAYLQERLAEQVEFGSLLNPLLNLSLPQSQVVGSLDAQTRRQKLFELIARILAEAARDGGHVVVMEDLHWMDESSMALAGHLASHSAEAPILLLLTNRPTEIPADLEGTHVTRVDLAELSESESLAMVREALDVADLPAEVGEAVYAKTKGNPLFLEEVIHSLQAPGVIDRILAASSVTRAAELAALAIPDRVQGLLMSRIDRLPPDTREVLKTGSVVGRSFGAQVLAGIDDELLRPVALDRALEDLIGAALVVRGEGADGSTVTFRHALVQDVAYESMPFARRRDLHGRVARYLDATQSPSDHALLVHHYRHAGDADETRIHAVRASESSVAVYANREAIDYLALAFDTARGRTPRDACLRSRLEELTGDCLETAARHDEAVERYMSARQRWRSAAVRQVSNEALCEISPIEDAEARDSALCWKVALSAERGRSAYKRALRWLDKAAASLPADRTGLAARTLITRAGVLTRLGRCQEALGIAEEGVALARRDGDASLQAYALTILGYASFDLGLLERAIAADTEALASYEQAGDLSGQAMSQANVAANYQLTGDLRAALEHHELSLAHYARLANMRGMAIAHGNLGELLLQMGDTHEALKHLEEAVRFRVDHGVSPSLTGFALVNLCRARLRSGDVEAAERALAEGRDVLQSIDARALLLDAGVMEAELRMAQGDLEEAERSCRAVLSDAQAMGADLNEAQALCLLGRIYLANDDPEAAIGHVQACVALAEKSGSEYERAQALAVLAEAQASCDDADDACADTLAEAIRLFEKMGARYDLDRAVEVRARLESPGLRRG
jgi:class 3 adenylate cyclase/tetratricopeptide (TPR) repeat protein